MSRQPARWSDFNGFAQVMPLLTHFGCHSTVFSSFETGAETTKLRQIDRI